MGNCYLCKTYLKRKKVKLIAINGRIKKVCKECKSHCCEFKIPNLRRLTKKKSDFTIFEQFLLWYKYGSFDNIEIPIEDKWQH